MSDNHTAVQVLEDSHEHCDSIGCKNPYREETASV